ncbi:sperm motility kinase Y-like [Bradysia coprophila]|uniref:sperm motility kinase Y-like n=1 Tax=Bradysia coprophila TaxID=38358 RepID=UPI00187DBE26|nr:sperm motility kinase Y-like [Bradysia coprophila]
MVMEYQQNGSLLDYMNSRPDNIPVEQAQQIIVDMCIGLHHLHSMSIIHGDMKPENVLLNGRMRAQLADFGMSLPIEPGRFYNNVWGTVDYQAPEQLIQNGLWDERVDYFVVGIIYVMMTAGIHPFGVIENEIKTNTMALQYRMPEVPANGCLFIHSTLCIMEHRLDHSTVLNHQFIRPFVNVARGTYSKDTVIIPNVGDIEFIDNQYFFGKVTGLEEPTLCTTINAGTQTSWIDSNIDWQAIEAELSIMMPPPETTAQVTSTSMQSIGSQKNELYGSGSNVIVIDVPVIQSFDIATQKTATFEKMEISCYEQTVSDDEPVVSADEFLVDRTGMDFNENKKISNKKLRAGLCLLKDEMKKYIQKTTLARSSQIVWFQSFFHIRCCACRKLIKTREKYRGVKDVNVNWSAQPFRYHFAKHLPKKNR